jgi:monofunctional biosynthetic peptidoglycan transglycosylase
VAESRSLLQRILRGVAYLVLGWVVITAACVLTMRWVNPWTTAFIVQDRFTAWRQNDKTYVYRRQWIELARIAPPMRIAVVASEDQKFPDHWGFDFAQIEDALDDRDHGRRTRGASTISQQVAKNLFLWPGQSWVRKGIEAYLTVLIEALWPKRRILEVYLNVAEFGHGVYGVEAASRAYFKKSAAQLTTYDAALLAAVLPNPLRLNAAAPTFYVRSRQNAIVSQMRRLGGPGYLRNL